MVDDSYTLKRPVTYEGAEYVSVTLNRINGHGLVKAEREMRANGAAQAGELERTMYLLAQAAGVPVEAVLLFDSADITELSMKAQALGFF